MLQNSFKISNNQTINSLFSKYFKPYPENRTDLKRSENTSLSQKDYAFFIYQQKDYKEATINFKYALIDHPNDASIRFYLGVSFLAMANLKEAETQFNIILRSENDQYHEASQWYIALIFLKKNNLKEAKVLFEKLESQGSEFSKRAIELSKEMEKLTH